jgi:uncharacterized damage-inducible protein DinB
MQPIRLALALLLVGSIASAQTPAPKAVTDQAPAAGQVLERQLASLEREFVPAAEALDEARFGFAPTAGEFKGVKTFAEQVRHVASANFMFAAGIAGEKAPADLGGENGPEALKTKAEIIKYLKDSFAYAHRAFAGITDANATAPIPAPWGKGTTTRLSLATLTVAHGFDHYGQMAVYLRMNGIIPPASRQ